MDNFTAGAYKPINVKTSLFGMPPVPTLPNTCSYVGVHKFDQPFLTSNFSESSSISPSLLSTTMMSKIVSPGSVERGTSSSVEDQQFFGVGAFVKHQSTEQHSDPSKSNFLSPLTNSIFTRSSFISSPTPTLFGKPVFSSTNFKPPVACNDSNQPTFSKMDRDVTNPTKSYSLFGKDGKSNSKPASEPWNTIKINPDKEMGGFETSSTSSKLVDSLQNNAVFKQENSASIKVYQSNIIHSIPVSKSINPLEPVISSTSSNTTKTTDEIKLIKSILCEGVPEDALSRLVLEKHFARFGNVLRISINHKKFSAIVHFEDHKSARKAKERGRIIEGKGQMAAIFYSKSRPLNTIGRTPEIRDMPTKARDKSNTALAVSKLVRVAKATLVSRTSTRKRVNSPINASVSSCRSKPACLDELIQIMRTEALTDNAKLLVLEAKDKYYRYKMNINRSSNDQVSLVGTCVDMCPERERYSRADKNQLRIYEKLETNGQVDHKSCIKEYSRSSADQEVPLPYELRTVEVLSLTMDHLLCNIIDRIDIISGVSEGGCILTGENIGEWFEFVWNTTRAIRKDITQQHITNYESVMLVEKCARFHIMCAERLTEETSRDFDAKLNDENLTKCIQSLKYMYYDLRLRGLTCPKESEFRAYEILLNINTGDIMRSIQNFDSSIMKSPQVSFAIKILLAVDSGNYVRFFKLVQRATFLQGCILHRYFTEIRNKALTSIVHAYCPGKKTVQMELEKLSQILCYESVEHCSGDLCLHGIQCDVKNGVVVIDRASFHFPSEQIGLQRSFLIESKRCGLMWSEIVNGGPLPRNPILTYIPTSSFDAEGFLKDNTDRKVSLQVKNRSNDPTYDVMNKMKYIVDSVLVELVPLIVTQVIEKFKLYDKVSHRVLTDLCDSVISSELNILGKSLMKECLDYELMQRLKQKNEESAHSAVNEKMLYSVCQEMVHEIAVAEIHKTRTLFKIAHQIAEDICQEVIHFESVSIVKGVIDQAAKLEFYIIKMIRKNQMNLIRKSFFAWNSVCDRKRKRLRMLANFPSQASQIKADDFKHSIKPSSCRRRRPTAKSLVSLDRSFKAIDIEDSIIERTILDEFNLETIVLDALRQKFIETQNICWKLVIIVPYSKLDKHCVLFCEMIKRKFRRCHSVKQTNLLCRYSVNINDYNQTLSLCVKFFAGLDSELKPNIETEMCGTSGILLLHFNGQEASNCFLSSLLSNTPKDPPIPLVIFSDASQHISDGEIAKQFNLDEYENDGHLSIVCTVFNDSHKIFNVKSYVQLQKCVAMLADLCPKPFSNQLKIEPITSYVENFMQTHVFCPLYDHLWSNFLRPQNPTLLIDFFNSALHHLEVTLMDSKLKDVSWPITEFDSIQGSNKLYAIPYYWKTPSYRKKLCDLIRALKLPPMIGDGNEYVIKYFNQFIWCEHVPWMDVRSNIISILDNDSNVSLPWISIIRLFIDYRLRTLEIISQDHDYLVVYRSDSLGAFLPPISLKYNRRLPTTQDFSLSRQSIVIPSDTSVANEEDVEINNFRTLKRKLEKILIDSDCTEFPVDNFMIQNPVKSKSISILSSENPLEDKLVQKNSVGKKNVKTVKLNSSKIKFDGDIEYDDANVPSLRENVELEENDILLEECDSVRNKTSKKEIGKSNIFKLVSDLKLRLMEDKNEEAKLMNFLKCN